MCAPRFTQEQILSGIRMVWREELGFMHPFTPDTRIDDQLKEEGVWNAIDLDEVIGDLECLFDFSAPAKDWENLFGCHVQDGQEWESTGGARCTFRGLADFIGERLTPISFEPVMLLGRSCLTAGVFRGLQQLAVQVHPRVGRFAPSTPIRRCLRGVQLRRFWNRLRWMIEDQLPPPRTLHFRSKWFVKSLFLKILIPVLIALWRRDWNGIMVALLFTFALVAPVGLILDFINNRLNPLPKGIETFGDLARVLAAIILDQQSERASCSMS